MEPTMQPAYLRVTPLSPDGNYVKVQAFDSNDQPLPCVETSTVGEEYHVTSVQFDEGDDAVIDMEADIHFGYMNTVLSVYHQAYEKGYEVDLEKTVHEEFGEGEAS